MSSTVLSAGLSPAWQEIVVLDALRVGEVNRAREVHWCASGKVLNVGLALHRLSAGDDTRQPKTLSLLGGAAGDSIAAEFAAEGASARWVRSSSATRVCTTLLDRTQGCTTEIVENARSVPAAELAAFRQAFQEEAAGVPYVVLTGSLPAGAPAGYLAELLPLTSARCILDFRGESLLQALESKPFLIKPNREELGQTIDGPLTSDADLLSAMRELNDRGAEYVLVTQGGDRAWLTSRTETWYAEPPAVTVVNPIGSGDCLAAGLAWSLSTGSDIPTAFGHAVAAATLNTQHLLPARITAEQVRRFAGKVTVHRAS